jgi:RimJ/RimL family protein N-acetyltransferase
MTLQHFDLVAHLKQRVQTAYPDWVSVDQTPELFKERSWRMDGHKHAWYAFFIKEGAQSIGDEILGSIQDFLQYEEDNRRIVERQFWIYVWKDESIILSLYFIARTLRQKPSSGSSESLCIRT